VFQFYFGGWELTLDVKEPAKISFCNERVASNDDRESLSRLPFMGMFVQPLVELLQKSSLMHC
jgi:hypothetical protein